MLCTAMTTTKAYYYSGVLLLLLTTAMYYDEFLVIRLVHVRLPTAVRYYPLLTTNRQTTMTTYYHVLVT